MEAVTVKSKRAIPFALAVMMLLAMLSHHSALGIGLVTLNVSPQKQVYSVGETVTVSIPDNGYSQTAIYVSWMFKATELDANGSLNYLNTARIGKKRGNTTFMNLLNGNAVMVNVRLDQVFNIQLDLDSDIQITQIGSIGCIRYKYTNIYGGGGLLSEEAALKIYNSNVQWKDIVKIGFKDEWNALLDGDMDN